MSLASPATFSLTMPFWSAFILQAVNMQFFVSVLLLACACACWPDDDVNGCAAVHVLLIGLVNAHFVNAELEMLVSSS
jgi:hypothetical protein